MNATPVAMLFASLGALFPVRFPSGRRIQFVFANATFAVFLVSGIVEALLTAWFASALELAITSLRTARTGIEREARREALYAPIAMTVALVVGEVVARLVSASRPMPLRDLGTGAQFTAVLVSAYVTFVAVKELVASRAGSLASIADPAPLHDRAHVLYAASMVVGAPLQVLAHLAYLSNGVVPWAMALAWSLLFNAVAALEAKSARDAYRLVAALAARERLAAIGEVTARVTHQMRHQIGLIGMSLHQIESRVSRLDEEHAAFVRRELANLERAQDELRQLLVTDATARSGGGSFRQVFEAPIARLVPLADSRRVVIERTIGDVPECAPRDPDTLSQGWFNLLENAVSAAASRVRIRIESTTTSIAMIVEDDGPGMTDAIRARATEPFFTTKDGGSGMGLAIARAVVEDEGGQLLLEAVSPHGTRATFVVPLDRSKR